LHEEAELEAEAQREEEDLRQQFLEHKKRVLEELQSITDIAKEDLEELERLNQALQEKKQRLAKLNQLKIQINEASEHIKSIQQSSQQ